MGAMQISLRLLRKAWSLDCLQPVIAAMMNQSTDRTAFVVVVWKQLTQLSWLLTDGAPSILHRKELFNGRSGQPVLSLSLVGLTPLPICSMPGTILLAQLLPKFGVLLVARSLRREDLLTMGSVVRRR
jgi:hypothetical protein